MKLMTPKQMKEVDSKAINEYGIPGILLMEHAAYSIYQLIRQKTTCKRITIICGAGNNGGDGLALARQLMVWTDVKLKVIMLADPQKLTSDGKIYYNICKKIEVELLDINQLTNKELNSLIEESEIIVDALLGTGLSRDVEGIYAEVIDMINSSNAYIISVDIPSGIDGETGKIMHKAVKANRTLTFVTPKIGLCLYPAIDYIGKLDVIDIGIPRQIIEEMTVNTYTLEGQEMSNLLPYRPTRSNKGTYGKVLIIGGQRGMSGAPILTSLATLKIGAGLVTAAVPNSIHDIMEQKLTEVMTIPIEDEEGHFGKGAAKQIEEILYKYDLIAIGPGMGRDEGARQIVKIVLESNKPCVIDADGLFFVKDYLNLIRNRKEPVIMTPHPGEMSRMTGLSIEEILEDSINITRKFALENNVILVLKIERMVIGSTSGDIYINRGGNTGMAKGGSGDLLTGIIAGLWAQNMKPVEATRLGVYIAARAGDVMANEKSQYTLLPTDVLEGVDRVMQELIKSI